MAASSTSERTQRGPGHGDAADVCDAVMTAGSLLHGVRLRRRTTAQMSRSAVTNVQFGGDDMLQGARERARNSDSQK